MTQPYFTKIQAQIIQELKSAHETVYVAVAWFTAHRLFRELCALAERGVDVQLIIMDDQITRNCSIDYSILDKKGGKVYLISESWGILMHNKFCVIDENLVITGSYNWSQKAESNHENITVTKDEAGVARSFIGEFVRIKESYYGKEVKKTFDLNIVSKRLNVILGLVELGDYVETRSHVKKLLEYDLTAELLLVVDKLETGEWQLACSLIKDFLTNAAKIRLFSDCAIEELRWKIKYLEIEIVTLEEEKEIVRKSIFDFVHQYTLRFGALLEKILRLKKEKLAKGGMEKRKFFEQAEKEYAEFKHKFQKERDWEQQLFNLSEEDAADIKKLYRAAAKMCHPDKVKNAFPDKPELWEKAEELFKRLTDAYDLNDVKTVRQIYDNLLNGLFDMERGARISDIEFLRKRYEELKAKHDALTEELVRLRNNDDYKLLNKIYDMDEFYHEEEDKLKNEINDLENEQ